VQARFYSQLSQFGARSALGKVQLVQLHAQRSQLDLQITYVFLAVQFSGY
jgi:hypothetical protein